MPAIRTYVVTREQEVKVRAESPAHAVAEAQALFDGTATDIPAPTLSSLKDVSIAAREEY